MMKKGVVAYEIDDDDLRTSMSQDMTLYIYIYMPLLISDRQQM
jgi:hypothetical protein